MPNVDTLIARIALSLWSSARRVEKLPTVVVVQPWERAELVGVPASLYYPAIIAMHPRFEGI